MRSRRLIFRNRGKGLFENMSTQLGPALQRPIVGRGAAYGDFDNDGDLDLVITEANGPARLLRNDNGNQNDMLRVKLIGTRSNRDGIGAKLTLQVDKNLKLLRMVKTGSGYLSQSELPVTFGLGKPDPGRRMRLTDCVAQRAQRHRRKLNAQPGHHRAGGEGDRRHSCDRLSESPPTD